MEKLRELLGEELYKQVVGKLPQDKKFVFGEEGNFIPKHRFDEVNTQFKETKELLGQRDSQLKEFGEKVKGNDELSKLVEQLKKENAESTKNYETKILEQQRSFAIDTSLTQFKARNPKAVKALLELERVVLQDGKVTGLNEQLEGLVKTDPYLFEQAVIPAAPAPKAGAEVKAPTPQTLQDQMKSLQKL